MAQAFLEDIPQASFTDETIRRMYELVDRAKIDEKFQKLIYSVVNHAMPGRWKDYRGELENLLRWVKQNVDYRRDPYNVELVQDVWATLDRRRGDCDDMALLFAAGAEILGAPARFVTISTRQNKQPSHVYVEVYVDGQWTSVDPIMQESFVGWEPTDGVTAKRIWTRKSLGLDGYDADDPVEGLGMNDHSMPDGWTYDKYNVTSRPGGPDRWEGGFADRMFSVNLTPWPNDISATFAPGVPGSEIIMRRVLPGALISPTSDPFPMERPGGGVYSPQFPIMDREEPAQIFKTIPQRDVPMVLNPDVWTGSVPDATVDPNAMLPQKAVNEEAQLVDLAGVGISPAQLSRLSPEERQDLHDEYRRCVKEACEKAKDEIAKCREARAAAGLSGLGITYLTERELELQPPIMGEYMDTPMGEDDDDDEDDDDEDEVDLYDEDAYADEVLLGEGTVTAFEDEEEIGDLGLLKKGVRRDVVKAKLHEEHKKIRKAKLHKTHQKIREDIFDEAKKVAEKAPTPEVRERVFKKARDIAERVPELHRKAVEVVRSRAPAPPAWGRRRRGITRVITAAPRWRWGRRRGGWGHMFGDPQEPIMGEYMNTLMGLGQEVEGGFMSDATKIVATIASTVTAGIIPKDKVESALNFAVDYWAKKKGITTPTAPDVPPPVYEPKPTIVKAGIGAATLIPVAIGAYLVLTHTGKKPRRRRTRARRRRR